MEPRLQSQEVSTEFDTPQTMSSREIAQLCGKEHSHVCRDIRKMLDELEISQSRFGSTYKDAQNKDRTEFLLPKSLTLTLVAGYHVKLRNKIIRRWMELEAANDGGFKIPQNMSEALRLAADEHERANQAEAKVIEMAPKVEALERLENADGTFCFQVAAKMLKVRPKDLFEFLNANRWIYRRIGGPWAGYQSKIQAGYLDHVEHVITNSSGHEQVRVQCRVTAKGLARISEMLGKEPA